MVCWRSHRGREGPISMPCRISEANLGRLIDHTNTFLSTCPLSEGGNARRYNHVTTPLEHLVDVISKDAQPQQGRLCRWRDIRMRSTGAPAVFVQHVLVWGSFEGMTYPRAKLNHCTVEHDDIRDVQRRERPYLVIFEVKFLTPAASSQP